IAASRTSSRRAICSRWTRSVVRVNSTRQPFSTSTKPSAAAKCDLPVPGGPNRIRLALDFPPGAGGFANEPGTPGGKDGGEANPTELHEGGQGAGGEAAAGRRQGAVGGGDGAWHWHRAAQPMAHRAPGGRLGRGT